MTLYKTFVPTHQLIAAMKALIKPAHEFSLQRFQELSEETKALNEKLNYKYGGTIT